jgi:hypothetical protein
LFCQEFPLGSNERTKRALDSAGGALKKKSTRPSERSSGPWNKLHNNLFSLGDKSSQRPARSRSCKKRDRVRATIEETFGGGPQGKLARPGKRLPNLFELSADAGDELWVIRDAHMVGARSPGDPRGAGDAEACLSYRSNWLGGIVEWRKIGPNFHPEVGFMERTDSNETYGDLTSDPRSVACANRNAKDLRYLGLSSSAAEKLARFLLEQCQAQCAHRLALS